MQQKEILVTNIDVFIIILKGKGKEMSNIFCTTYWRSATNYRLQNATYSLSNN